MTGTVRARLGRGWPAACVSAIGVLLGGMASAEGPGDFLDRDDSWFAGAEARRLADHLLSHQSDLGGWPKNLDTTAKPFVGDRASIRPTFDNGATTDELRFLARIVKATGQDRDREAFLRGLRHILDAQYDHGGWPQRFPAGSSYHRHVTFNDDAMVRLMEFLREVASSETYDFVPGELREEARRAFDRGVECILRCQVEVDGRLTVWCAQHDADDLSPAGGRSYELPSLSGAESVGIVRLLMSLEQPGPEVIRAVEGAMSWFEEAKLQGIRLATVEAPEAPRGRDRVVLDDPDAAPLWARFSEIGTNTPLFVDRDGVPKPSLAEISHERRNGYGWLGTWPRRLFDRDYPAWKRRLGR